MQLTEVHIRSALSHVIEPDLRRDLITLGMVEDIVTDGLQVRFTIVLTTPACPLKERIRRECVEAIHLYAHPDAEVTVNFTSNVTTGVQIPDLSHIRNIIAVISGKGGVGKSTVAANLAIALAQSGARTALVDGDIHGPSIPVMFGLVGERPWAREENGRVIMEPLEKYGVKLNSVGFLRPQEKAYVWRGPMASKILNHIIRDTDWGEIDYMIFDMPPGTGDLHISLVQHLAVTGIVVVTTPQEVALADARKGANMYLAPEVNVPVLGIVENMAYFVPHDLPDRKYYIFGQGGGDKLAQELNLRLLAQIPLVEQVREQADAGHPAALDPETPVGQAFRELAETLARLVAIRNTQLPPSQPLGLPGQQ